MVSIRGKRKRRASINSRSKLAPPCRLACRLIALREKAAGGKRRGPPSIGSWEITTCRSRSTITRPADVETVCIRIEPMKPGCGIDAIFLDGTSGNAQAGRSGRYGEQLAMSILAEKSLDRPVMNKYETLFHRHPSNPILTGKDWPYSMNSVFNAGATLLPDGSTLLLCRVEDRRGLSHLCVARSANGVDGWQIDREPTFIPDVERFPEELWGVEDPRITYMPELQQYAVAYTSYSRGGPGVSLALTKDFRVFEKLGVVMSPDDKDAALLPRRINGFWALIHRPMTPLGAHIWISYSPDLRHWGNHKLMLEARRGAWWDANKIGMSPPPIETSRGWLMIYHGVRRTPSSSIYRLGLALFDLEQPEKCLIRGDSWMFAPEAEYERHGDVQDVVFPCGYTVAADGDTINLYYGAADSSIALAHGSIRSLLSWLDANGHSEHSGDRRHK